MPEPASSTAASTAIGEWDRLRPEGVPSRYQVGPGTDRDRCVSGLRELADLLQARPELPVGRHEHVAIFVDGTAAEKRAQVDYAGSLLGAPVQDDTPGGGHYIAAREFGPVSYEVIATGVGAPYFAVGDDVRLDRDAAAVAKDACLAQAGYVTAVMEDREGEYSYAVHFPGRAGDQRGWSQWSLARVRFRPVSLSGGEVTGIRDAETRLIELGARLELAMDRSVASDQHEWGDFRTLSAGLADVLGIEPDVLVRQLTSQFGLRYRELGGSGSRQGKPASVAANDAVSRLAPGTVPAQPAAPDSMKAAGPARPAHRKQPGR